MKKWFDNLVVKPTLVGSAIGLVVVMAWASSCSTTREHAVPLPSAVARTSWAAGMQPGCFVVGVPVAWECVEGHPEYLCPADPQLTEVHSCWWAFYPGDGLWFQP